MLAWGIPANHIVLNPPWCQVYHVVQMSEMSEERTMDEGKCLIN